MSSYFLLKWGVQIPYLFLAENQTPRSDSANFVPLEPNVLPPTSGAQVGSLYIGGGAANGTVQTCFDNYGDTGANYCLKEGSQNVAVRRMVGCIKGAAPCMKTDDDDAPPPPPPAVPPVVLIVALKPVKT